MSIGSMVGPDAFTEVKYLQNYKQSQALKLIPELAAEFKKQFGRDSGGLLRTYRAEDAEMIVVAMGSVNGTIKDTIDEMRAEGFSIGLVILVSYRPFPEDELRKVLAGRKQVVVVEKSFAIGMGGQLAADVDHILGNVDSAPHALSCIAGLGGRPITRSALREAFHKAKKEPWEGMYFLDLNQKVVTTEVEHMSSKRRSGPTAENILRRISATPAAE